MRKDILELRASREYNNNNTSTFNLQDPESIDNDNCLMAKIQNPNILKWFNKNVIYELLTIKLKIDLLEENHIRDFLLVAFSSILRSASNANSGFGNLIINKKPPSNGNIFKSLTVLPT